MMYMLNIVKKIFIFLIYGLYTLDNAFLVGVDEEYSFSPGKFYP